MKITGITFEAIRDILAQGYWEQKITAEYWDKNAIQFPNEVAVADVKGSLTWAQVKEQAENLALRLLDLGVKRDEVMLFQLPNWVEFIVARLACIKAGILSCQPAVTLRHEEMGHILKITKAVGVAIPRQFRNFDYFKMISSLGRISLT